MHELSAPLNSDTQKQWYDLTCHHFCTSGAAVQINRHIRISPFWVKGEPEIDIKYSVAQNKKRWRQQLKSQWDLPRGWEKATSDPGKRNSTSNWLKVVSVQLLRSPPKKFIFKTSKQNQIIRTQEKEEVRHAPPHQIKCKISTQNSQTERESNARGPNQKLARTQSTGPPPTESKSNLPSEKSLKMGPPTPRYRTEQEQADRGRKRLTLGLRFSTATLGAMAKRNKKRSELLAATQGGLLLSTEQRGLCPSLSPPAVSWRIGDGKGQMAGAYKEERSGGTRTETNQRRRPVARRKASGRRTDGRRPELRFWVKKVSSSLIKKSEIKALGGAC